MKQFISFALMAVVSLPLFAEEIPGKTLLSYFSGTCKTSSQWTQAAIADSEALIKSLSAMMSDPDCAGASGAISQLNNLSSQLATLNKLNDTKKTVATLNAEEQALLIQLTLTTDAGVISEINSGLRQLQVSRAKLLNGDKSAEKLSGEDKAVILGKIAQTANTSFQQITANERCLNKHPSLLNSATSIMAGVGEAVTAVNPAVGLSMTAGASFAKTAMDGIQNTRLARKIRKIADSTITFEAYSCALESMSERWCQMRDAEEFLKFKAKHRRNTFRNPNLAQAISLNDREIPVILDWLNKVRNGVTPRTTADAERRNVVLTRELMVRTKSDYGQSLIEQNRKTYDSMSNNPKEQWDYLRTIIISLVSPNYSPNGSVVKDPLTDINPYSYAFYYLLGLSDTDERIRVPNQGNMYADFSSWTKPAEIVVSLDSVKVKYKEWIDRAANLVNRELNEVQQPDPLQTLSSANIEAEPWMVTPIDALKSIADFLEKNPPHENQRDFKKLYADTLQKLRSIHEVAVVAITTGDMEARPIGNPVRFLTPIERIYEDGQLKYGIIVLQARLEMIVRLSLLEYIKSSPEEDQILLAQLLASDRFYETISKMNGTTSYAGMREDLKSGKAYTMMNLSLFMEIFGHNINRTLRNLYMAEWNKKSSPTVARSNRDLRTSLCFLVLGAENVKDWIEAGLCTGLKMEAMQAGGPESITITAETLSQDLATRACAYRDYFRKSDLYQKWGNKNKE